MMAHILVIGKDGQVGRALTRELGEQVLALGQPDINLLDPGFTKSLDAAVGHRPISAVINAAAYMQVDKAEGEGRDDAIRINHTAVGELARWCAAKNFPLVHFSTDYVFSGEGNRPWKEDDATGPLNQYGKSKLMGEREIITAGGRHLIFRTCWVFDAEGKNFANTMLRLFAERETLNVVNDQIGAPTYAPHLGQAVLSGLQRALAMPVFPSGLYHLCAQGTTSWHEYATRILMLARNGETGQKKHLICKHIQPVMTSEYPAAARRPLNSRLDCSKAGEVLGIELGRWETGLDEFFRVKYGC